MANYPYVYSVTRFKDFLSQIKRARDPKIADHDWLNKLTFEQQNDRAFYRVLKYIDFISEDNETSDLWRSYRVDGELSGSMATAIVLGYSELFEIYEEAWICTDDELKSVFKQAGASDKVAEMSLSTFRALCSLADFSQHHLASSAAAEGPREEPAEEIVESDKVPEAEPGAGRGKDDISQGRPTFAPEININLQIHITPDADETQINNIFASMKTHLFGE